ncbi:MAG: cupin domain-containing protein [Lachnospiraceae bacterium]
MKVEKGQKWCFWDDAEAEGVAEGIERRILAYCDEMMCVENTFKAGGIGAMHQHPHTQITYVAKGRFRFTIGEETREVKTGDTLLKQNGIIHGCECLEDGILVDFFTPMREDFLG